MRSSTPAVSVVIPAYNEAVHLEDSLRAIQAEFESIESNHEIIVVDDGSSDSTWSCLKRMAAADHRVRAFRLSRNFGKEAAICAGLAQVRSAGVIVMDSDLQHPPVLIREMVRAWREEGFDVVEAVKTSSRLQSTLFHRLFQLLAGIPLKGASDFKFMNRRVLNAWADLPERTVFFRGMSAWLGFRRKEIPFVVPKRSSGGPK